MERPKRPLVTNIPVAKNEDMHNANKVQLYISELESYADQEHARAERLMGELDKWKADWEVCSTSLDHVLKLHNDAEAKLHALESQLKQAKEWAGKAIANFGIYFERNPQTWLDDKKPLLVVAYDCVLKSRDALSDTAELKETHENP